MPLTHYFLFPPRLAILRLILYQQCANIFIFQFNMTFVLLFVMPLMKDDAMANILDILLNCVSKLAFSALLGRKDLNCCQTHKCGQKGLLRFYYFF